MALQDQVGLAFKAIGGNRLRSMLTILIIAIGISALVGMMTALNGLTEMLNRDFASMGANSMSIRSTSAGAQGWGEKIGDPISYRQANKFKQDFPLSATISIHVDARSNTTVKYQGRKTNPTIAVRGVDENYLQVNGYELDRGRTFSALELQYNSLICILGDGVVARLFGDNVDPIGKSVLVAGQRLTVVGTLASKGASFMSTDNFMLVPLSTARSYIIQGSPTYQVNVQVMEQEKMDAAYDASMGLFRQVRKLHVREANDFNIIRSDKLEQELIEAMSTVGIGGIVIGIFTLLGAAIGLMNILLVSVNERTREIGLSMAIGAKRTDIRRQFLVESITICLLGGIAGVLLGLVFGNYTSMMLGSSFSIPWKWLGVGLGLTAVVGLIAGIYPSIKASKLDPIEALRYE